MKEQEGWEVGSLGTPLLASGCGGFSVRRRERACRGNTAFARCVDCALPKYLWLVSESFSGYLSATPVTFDSSPVQKFHISAFSTTTLPLIPHHAGRTIVSDRSNGSSQAYQC